MLNRRSVRRPASSNLALTAGDGRIELAVPAGTVGLVAGRPVLSRKVAGSNPVRGAQGAVDEGQFCRLVTVAARRRLAPSLAVRPRLVTGWLVDAVILHFPSLGYQQFDAGDLVPLEGQVGDDLQVPVL